MTNYYTQVEDELLLKLKEQGLTYEEISDKFYELGYDRSAEGLRKRYKILSLSEGSAEASIKSETEPLKPKLTEHELSKAVLDILIKKNGLKLDELKERFRKRNITRTHLLNALDNIMEEGYNIKIDKGLVFLGEEKDVKEVEAYYDWENNRTFSFGLIADTHLGSKYQQITALKDYYEHVHNRGITTVVHAGDVVDGYKVYDKSGDGHLRELWLTSFTDQKEYVIDQYPYYPDMKTYFIEGNHDRAFWSQVGISIGHEIGLAREDLICLGAYGAVIDFGGYKVHLHHGAGGTAYALSYKLQKLIEEITMPDINLVLMGHYHTYINTEIRDIRAIQPGCFQAMTPYAKRRGWITPTLLGLIMHVTLIDNAYHYTFEEFKYKPKDWDYDKVWHIPTPEEKLKGGIIYVGS